MSGRIPTGRHAGVWSRGLPHRDKLQGVYWVKAHLDEDEAIARARAGRYPSWYHCFNNGECAFAQQGAMMHTEDPGSWALRQWQLQPSACRYLIDVYKIARAQPLNRVIVGCPPPPHPPPTTCRAGRTSQDRADRPSLVQAARADYLGRNAGMPTLWTHIKKWRAPSQAEARSTTCAIEPLSMTIQSGSLFFGI